MKGERWLVIKFNSGLGGSLRDEGCNFNSFHLQRHYASRLGLQDVQTLEPSGIILRVSRRREHLALRRRPENSAAGLRLGLPRGSEALPLHRCVSTELDDHEIRGRDEQLVTEFLLAGKGREVHRFLLGSTAHEDLHYVEALLGLEFLELKRARATIESHADR